MADSGVLILGIIFLYATPLGPVLLVVGWANNFRLIIKRHRFQENLEYILLSICAVISIIAIVFYRARQPSLPDMPLTDLLTGYALKIAANPWWLPISLLAFASTSLLPLTTDRRRIIFSSMNWLAMVFLIAIPLWYLSADEAAHPELGFRSSLLNLFVSGAFAVTSLFLSKRSSRTQWLKPVVVIVIAGLILIAAVIWNGLSLLLSSAD